MFPRDYQVATGGHAMMGEVTHHWKRGQSMHSMGSKSMEEVSQWLFCQGE